MPDAIQIVVTTAIFVVHLALVGIGAYGDWYEVAVGVVVGAFLYVVAAAIGAYGAWRSAEALTNRTWVAVRVPTFTFPAAVVLSVALTLVTWSRSGP